MMNNRGVTFIELVVAMVVGATIISLAFGFWGSLNKQVFSGQKQNIHQAELINLAGKLTSQLRRSPAVLAWHDHGITFIEYKTEDTLVYEFYENTLNLNDTIQVGPKDPVFVSEFTVTTPVDELKPDKALLAIQTAINDGRGNVYSLESMVTVKMAKDAFDDKYESLNKWNF